MLRLLRINVAAARHVILDLLLIFLFVSRSDSFLQPNLFRLDVSNGGRVANSINFEIVTDISDNDAHNTLVSAHISRTQKMSDYHRIHHFIRSRSHSSSVVLRFLRVCGASLLIQLIRIWFT